MTSTDNNATQGVALLHLEGETIRLRAEAPDTQLLILGGEPIDEPIAAQGPFVMCAGHTPMRRTLPRSFFTTRSPPRPLAHPPSCAPRARYARECRASPSHRKAQTQEAQEQTLFRPSFLPYLLACLLAYSLTLTYVLTTLQEHTGRNRSGEQRLPERQNGTVASVESRARAFTNRD